MKITRQAGLGFPEDFDDCGTVGGRQARVLRGRFGARENPPHTRVDFFFEGPETEVVLGAHGGGDGGMIGIGGQRTAGYTREEMARRDLGTEGAAAGESCMGSRVRRILS